MRIRSTIDLLAQQKPERLGDQAREPVDLAVGRSPQEILHRRPRPRRELRTIRPRSSWANSFVDVALKQLASLLLGIRSFLASEGDLRFKATCFALQVGMARSRS